MIPENLQKFKNTIVKSKNILIVGHEKPDGDLIASALALKIALGKIGKNVCVYFDSLPINYFGFLPCIEDIDICKNNFDYEYDVVIGLDYGSIGQLHLPSSFKKEAFFITIDHHPVDGQIGDIKIVDDNKSSTCEIVYLILGRMGLEIDKNIADCLLCGIMTDTGDLQHQKVGAETLEIVGSLLEKGARPYKIAKNIARNHTITTLKLWGRILSRLQKDPKNLMSFSVVSKKDIVECGCSLEDVGGLVGIINTNPDTRLTLLLTEDVDFMRGSLRSEGYKGVDVSKIAKVFGGGGHKLASGFRSDEDLRAILRKIYIAMA